MVTDATPRHARIRQRGRPPAHALVEQGKKLLDRGEFQRAAEALKRAVQEAPGHPELHALLSDAYFRSKQPEPARAEMLNAIRLWPENSDFHASLGHILLRLGRYVSAARSFSRALEIVPNHPSYKEYVQAKDAVLRQIQNWHLPMLSDVARNAAYERALERAVRPGDVVLDIGTGTGLLSMMAARAGARHVYACEADANLADLAGEIVARNGLSDRVTVINKRSTDLVLGSDLPEPATLLVTEIFNSVLIGEGAVKTIDHARTHLLAPDARIVPRSGRIRGQLCAIPRLKQLYPLRSISGFDMSVFAELCMEQRFYPAFPEKEDWSPLTPTVPLIEFEFARMPRLQDSGRVVTTFTGEGQVHALLLSIELGLDEATRISSGPEGNCSHWNSMCYMLDDPPTAHVGDSVTIHWKMNDLALYFSCNA